MHKEGIGFLSLAINSDTVDYLKLAYVQALNIKYYHKNPYAVIVDTKTYDKLLPKYNKVFDYIIVLDNDDKTKGPFSNDIDSFRLSPFKETIKLESDLLLTRNIDHWLSAFRLKDVVLSYGCKNYKQEFSDSRIYRKFFDDNDLPDIYSGLMYFRYSEFASKFFIIAKQIQNNWNEVREQLKNCIEQYPSTDVLYAITAKVVGIENCCIPSMDFIKFVHMKSGIQTWNPNRKWTDIVNYEFDNDIIRVNNINQYDPFHYYEKNFINDEMEAYYEHRIGIKKSL